MKKIKIAIILLLMVFVVKNTYAAFVVSDNETGTIVTKELSTTFLGNAEFLVKVQTLDSSITSVDKTTDLVRITSVPSVSFTDSNIVSTSSSSVPIYLWVESGTIYYYTIATNVDLNNI